MVGNPPEHNWGRRRRGGAFILMPVPSSSLQAGHGFGGGTAGVPRPGSRGCPLRQASELSWRVYLVMSSANVGQKAVYGAGANQPGNAGRLRLQRHSLAT